MTITEYLDTLERAPRGNARVEAMAGFKATPYAQLLQQYLVTVHNPFVTFGVAKLPEADRYRCSQFFQDDAHWMRELLHLGTRLANRELTGGAARSAISMILADCNAPQQDWAERFLKKDLRLNIGAAEVNKAFGKGTVPVFEVPLATDYQKLKDKEWDLEQVWFLQPKLDGGRCVAFIDAVGEVELLSRNGKTWENFESVRAAVKVMAERYRLRDFVLDGEVVSLNTDGRIDFQQIQQTMHRGDGVEVGFLQYIVFDGCERAEWENPTRDYETRLHRLIALVGPEPDGKMLTVPYHVRIIDSQQCRKEKSLVEAEVSALVEQGYEGGILRRRDAVVQNKRTKDILKVKSFKDMEATIDGVVEGTGKYAGMLGALKCSYARMTGDGVATTHSFEIGSGYSDKQRREFWAMREQLPGQIATLKYFEMTKDHVPRFPIFKAIRHPSDIGKDES